MFIHGNDVNRRVQHAHTDGARKEGRGRRKTKNIYTHTHSINIFFVVLVYRRGQPNSRTRSSRRDLFPSHHTHTADSRCVCVCVCNAWIDQLLKVTLYFPFPPFFCAPIKIKSPMFFCFFFLLWNFLVPHNDVEKNSLELFESFFYYYFFFVFFFFCFSSMC